VQTKSKLFLLHLSFWVLFISYRLFDFTRHLPFESAALLIGVPSFFNIVISYLHYFFILPLLIKRKNIALYLALLVVSLAAIGYLRIVAEGAFLAPVSFDPNYYKTVTIARVLSILWSFLSFLLFTSMIKFTVDWFYLENRRKQLENEKLIAELKYLRAQINPHFLFNTLHNLNYLTLSKRNEASDVIIKLSNIMRYMIYDANKATVSIHKELQYMQDYIALERIRLNKSFDLQFNVTDSDKKVEIAPLLLITFLENAFKHGVSDQADACWIKVDLVYNTDNVSYSVCNSKVNNHVNKEKSGFGLDNLRKRLDLHYPDKHSLTVNETDDEFAIDLKIQL